MGPAPEKMYLSAACEVKREAGSISGEPRVRSPFSRDGPEDKQRQHGKGLALRLEIEDAIAE